MANERLTENLVRDKLRALGYYDNPNLIVEEQQSSSVVVSRLLKNASKKGLGRGYPEFIIRSKVNTDFMIIVECKADIKKHESKSRNEYGEYAVDGALLYGSFLAKQYDVLAIAVSGENKNELKVSQFLCLKETSTHHPFLGKDIVSFEDYYTSFWQSDIKFNQDYNKLLEYTKSLNESLHNKKIKEAQRSLLISGILIALQNNSFKSGYRLHKKSVQLANHLLTTIVDEFTNSNLPAEKINNLKQAFSFILTSTTLTSDKEFFENLIFEIDENINNFIRTHKYIDTLGQFYVEFLRYANNDKGLGIVLTPPHITQLFTDLAEVNKDSIVFDNCCGTSGFLISAMKRMVQDADGDSNKIKNLKSNQLIGVEYQDDIYALGVSNMVIHGDGKTNIFLGDCFELSDIIKDRFKPTVGLLNPPYKTKKGDIEELEFVLNNLATLQQGGKCVAIIPLSCAIALSGEGYELKKRLLENHTLEAVMSMPEELFHNSKVTVVTCAMVITAHKPHPKGKKTWLGYWREDGFVKLKNKGRVDLNNTWEGIKSRWLDAFSNREIVERMSLMEELTAEKEWCAEAYFVTDYNSIDKAIYKTYIQKYLAYRLLNNLLDLPAKKTMMYGEATSELVPITNLFEVKNGLSSAQVTRKDEFEIGDDVRYLRPSQSYGGSIDGYVDKNTVDEKYVHPEDTIYVSTDGQGSHTYAYVSSFEFIPNSNVAVLIPKREMNLQEKLFYAMCVALNRYKFSYGRKPKGDRLKDLLIPMSAPPYVSTDVFGEILENWKKVIS